MHVSDSIPIPQFNRSIEKPITFHVSFLKFFLMLDRAKCKISCHLSLLMKYNRVLSGLSYIGCNEQKLQKRDYLRRLNAEQFWFAIPNTLRFTVRENRLLTSSPIRWHWRHDGYSEVGFTDVQELTLAKEKTTTFHADLIDTVAFSSLYLSFSPWSIWPWEPRIWCKKREWRLSQKVYRRTLNERTMRKLVMVDRRSETNIR